MIKGRTSSKALEITINVGPNCFEGYELVLLTMPYDGDDKGPAMLMLKALEHARDNVSRAIDAARRLEIERKGALKKAADRRRESYMSID